jgi:hypothetical protein
MMEKLPRQVYTTEFRRHKLCCLLYHYYSEHGLLPLLLASMFGMTFSLA